MAPDTAAVRDTELVTLTVTFCVACLEGAEGPLRREADQ